MKTPFPSNRELATIIIKHPSCIFARLLVCCATEAGCNIVSLVHAWQILRPNRDNNEPSSSSVI
jgi:hypothetical protein